MEELYDLLDDVINSLNEEECIKKIKDIQRDISLDSDFVQKIRNYNGIFSVKMEILKNYKVSSYKKAENDVNYMILSINRKLNDLLPKGGFICENN